MFSRRKVIYELLIGFCRNAFVKLGNYSATDKKSMFFQQNAAILRIIAALH